MDPQEARIYQAVIITAIVLGTIIIYFTVSIIRQQRRNASLQQLNALAEITAMEKERARIAADLHDELGPVLSVIKFQVDNLEQVDREEKLQLEKASRSLDELIGKMREVANNLMPSALHRKGLVAAIEEFARNIGDSAAVTISFTAGERIDIAEEKTINIYRMVQEVVNNALKHGEAKKIEITMEQKNNTVSILCRDNGRGFDYPVVMREGNGIGLRSIKNRTDMMGGRLVVESKKNTGTAFIFEIPAR